MFIRPVPMRDFLGTVQGWLSQEMDDSDLPIVLTTQFQVCVTRLNQYTLHDNLVVLIVCTLGTNMDLFTIFIRH